MPNQIDGYALATSEQLEMATQILMALSNNATNRAHKIPRLSHEEAKQLAIDSLPGFINYSQTHYPQFNLYSDRANQILFADHDAYAMNRFVAYTQEFANRTDKYKDNNISFNPRNVYFNTANLNANNHHADPNDPSTQRFLRFREAYLYYKKHPDELKNQTNRENYDRLRVSMYQTPHYAKLYQQINKFARRELANNNARNNAILDSINQIIIPYTTSDQRKKINAEFHFGANGDPRYIDSRPKNARNMPGHEYNQPGQLAAMAYKRSKEVVDFLDRNLISARIAVDDNNTDDLVAYLPDKDNMKVVIYSNDPAKIGSINTYRNHVSISQTSAGKVQLRKNNQGQFFAFNPTFAKKVANQQDPFDYPAYTVLKSFLSPTNEYAVDTLHNGKNHRITISKDKDIYQKQLAEYEKAMDKYNHDKDLIKQGKLKDFPAGPYKYFEDVMNHYEDQLKLYKMRQIKYRPTRPYSKPQPSMDLYSSSSSGSLVNVHGLLSRQLGSAQKAAKNKTATVNLNDDQELTQETSLDSNETDNILDDLANTDDEFNEMLKNNGLEDFVDNGDGDNLDSNGETDNTDSSGEKEDSNNNLIDEDGRDENNEQDLARKIKQAQKTVALSQRVNQDPNDPSDVDLPIYGRKYDKNGQVVLKNGQVVTYFNGKHPTDPTEYDFYNMDYLVSNAVKANGLLGASVTRNKKTNVYKITYYDTTATKNFDENAKRTIILGGYIPKEPAKIMENGKMVDNPMAGARKIAYNGTTYGYSVPGMRGFVLGDKDNLKNDLYVANFEQLLKSTIAKQIHDQELNPRLSQDKRSYTAFDNLYTTEGYSTVIKKSSVNSPEYQQTLIKTLQRRVRLPDSLLSQANELNEMVSDKAFNAFKGGKTPEEIEENKKIRMQLALYRENKKNNMPNINSKDVRQAALMNMNFRSIPREFYDMVDYEMTGQGKTMGASLFLGSSKDVAIDPETGQVYPIAKDENGKPLTEKYKAHNGEIKVKYAKRSDQDREQNLIPAKSDLHKLPMFDHTENDPIDRNIMAFNQAIRNIPMDKVNVAYMTMGGFTENDAVVVTKKYAEAHPQHKADGTPDVLRDQNGEIMYTKDKNGLPVPMQRSLIPADKITDFHGNKSTIAVIVDPSDKAFDKLNQDLEEAQDKISTIPKNKNIDTLNSKQREDLHNYKFLKSLYRATLAVRANPELDVIASPYSAVSRLNTGSVHEMIANGNMKNLNNINNPSDIEKAKKFGIDPTKMPLDKVTMGKEIYGVCEGQRADEKTKNYTRQDYLKGNSRKFSHQLALAFGAMDMPNTLNYMYKDNVNHGWNNLLDDMRILGYDIDKNHNIGKLDYDNPDIKTIKLPDPQEAQKIGHNLVGEDINGNSLGAGASQAKRVAQDQYYDQKRQFRNMIYQAYYEMHPEELAQASDEDKAAVKLDQDKTKNPPKMLAFDLPDNVTYTPLGNKTKTTNRVILPVSQIFHDIKHQQEINGDPMAQSKWLNQYFDIYATASGLKLDEEKVGYNRNNIKQTVHKYNPWQATRKLTDLQNKVLSKDLDANKNIVKQKIFSSPTIDSSTNVVTPDSSLDLDTIAVDPTTYKNLHFKEGEPHKALAWRDPILRPSGVSYFNVICDPRLKHSVSINPANDKGKDMDHDGDTMAVVPVHSMDPKVRQELDKLLPSNNLINQFATQTKSPDGTIKQESTLETGLEMQGSLYKQAENGDQDAKNYLKDGGVLNSSICDNNNPAYQGAKSNIASQTVHTILDKAFDSDDAYGIGTNMLDKDGKPSKDAYLKSIEYYVKSGAKGNEKSVKDSEHYFDSKRSLDDVAGGMAGLGQKADAIGTAGKLQQTLATVFHNYPEMLNNSLNTTWGTTQLATKKSKTYKQAVNVMRSTMLTAHDAFVGSKLKIKTVTSKNGMERKVQYDKITPSEFTSDLKSTYHDLGVNISPKTFDDLAQALTTTDKYGNTHIMSTKERMSVAPVIDNLAYSSKGTLSVLNEAVKNHRTIDKVNPRFAPEVNGKKLEEKNIDSQFGMPEKDLSDYVLDANDRKTLSNDELNDQKQSQRQKVLDKNLESQSELQQILRENQKAKDKQPSLATNNPDDDFA